MPSFRRSTENCMILQPCRCQIDDMENFHNISINWGSYIVYLCYELSTLVIIFLLRRKQTRYSNRTTTHWQGGLPKLISFVFKYTWTVCEYFNDSVYSARNWFALWLVIGQGACFFPDEVVGLQQHWRCVSFFLLAEKTEIRSVLRSCHFPCTKNVGRMFTTYTCLVVLMRSTFLIPSLRNIFWHSLM